MRKEVMDVFHRWLEFDDDDPIDIIMASALAVMFPGDPLWLLVVGAPGAGKTEIVRSFTGDLIYPLDTLSSRALISGLRDPKNPNVINGIIQDIDGKLVTIKDLTVMLQTNNLSRAEDNVFNKLRAAYDGEYAEAHGSGFKRQAFRSRFGIIAAVTPVIDKYREQNSSLGERFVTVRVHQDSIKAICKAQENVGQEDIMRMELGDVVKEMMDYYKKHEKIFGIPEINDKDATKIRDLGSLVGKLRTPVDRDFRRNILSIPEPEVGTRLVKQFTRLAQMLSLYCAYDYKKVLRVARDSIHPNRLKTIDALKSIYNATPFQVHQRAKLSEMVAKEQLEDLWMLNILEKTSTGSREYYRFCDSIIEEMVDSEFI